MAWVAFTRDFDWRPNRQTVIAFKAGHRLSVTKACATQAIAKGAAEAVATPKRGASRGQ